MPKNYISSILAICIVITVSSQIYLPIFNISNNIIAMSVFNLIGIFIVHIFCSRGELKDLDFDDFHSITIKIIFFSQLIILFQLLIFVIVFLFIGIQRDVIFDLVLLLLIQGYLFLKGDDYKKLF